MEAPPGVARGATAKKRVWACGNGCGFAHSNFDMVAEHEESCGQEAVQRALQKLLEPPTANVTATPALDSEMEEPKESQDSSEEEEAKPSGFNFAGTGKYAGAFAPGMGVPDKANVISPLDMMQARADKGDPMALRMLAMMYENGKGVPKDPEKAATLYRLAAGGEPEEEPEESEDSSEEEEESDFFWDQPEEQMPPKASKGPAWGGAGVPLRPPVPPHISVPSSAKAKETAALLRNNRVTDSEIIAAAKPVAPSKVKFEKFHKIDDATEAFKLDTVKLSLSKRIQQGRMAKGLKQAELAKIIHETVAVVNSYEMGKAVPTNAVLGKMERALSVKLRGKM